MICNRSIIEIAVKKWLNNPMGTIPEKLSAKLDEWQKTCELNEYFDSLCSILFLRARIALASFQFDNVEVWLDRCYQTASSAGLQIYQNDVQNERERFLQYKQNMLSILEKEKIISPEKQLKMVRAYIEKAIIAKKEFEETQ